jgi:hypothetical protein
LPDDYEQTKRELEKLQFAYDEINEKNRVLRMRAG